MAASNIPFRKGLVPATSSECPICQRAFENNSILKSHMRLHGVSINSMKSHSKNTNTPKNNINVTKINKNRNSYKQNAENYMLISKKHYSNDVILRKSTNNKVQKGSAKCDSKEIGSENRFEQDLPQNIPITKSLYKCARCNKTCPTRALLDLHICKSKRCDKCYKPFRTLDKLSQHVAEMHPKSYNYTCMVCGVSFKTSLGYTKHMETHSGQEEGRQVYECSICKRKVYTHKLFIKHMRIHKKFYQCQMCTETFDTLAEQRFHSKYSHVRDRPFKCFYCVLSFGTKRTRNTHIKRIHKDSLPDKTPPEYDANKHAANTDVTLYDCTQCNISFIQEDLLRKHMTKVHWKEHKTVNKMKQTDAKVTTERTRIMPQLRHNDNNDKKAATKRVEGKNVMLTESLNNKDKRYTCEICEISYSRRDNLKVHMNEKHLDSSVHDKLERPGITVSEKNTVTHDLDTPIQPPLEIGTLSKSMNYSTNLYRKKKELNEKILQNYFVSNDSLKPSHVDPLTKKKLFLCEICSTTYTAKDSLARHIKGRAYDHGFYLKHKREEEKKAVILTPRFECDICNRKYTRRFNMLVHRQRHTEIEFRNAGVRGDVYNSPFGKTIIPRLEMRSASIPSTEQEVTSSTSTPASDEQSNRTDDVVVESYMARVGNGEFDTVEPEEHEPLYTASLYLPEMNTELETTKGECSSCVDELKLEKEETHERINRSCQIHEGARVPLNTPGISKQRETIENTINRGHTLAGDNSSKTEIKVQKETTEGRKILCHVHSVETIYKRSTEELNNSSTREDTNADKQVDVQDMTSQNESPTTPVQFVDTVSILTDTTSSCVSAVGDDRVCTTCSFALRDGQKSIRCALCDQTFCKHCSDMPPNIYNVLCSNEKESLTGILWTCNVCKHLVPKFTVLLRQLGELEQIFNNRLTDMEQRLYLMK